MKRWQAVFFDLDGTLADTVGLILRCFRHATEVHGLVGVSDQTWMATIGRPLRDQLREFVHDDDEVERIASTYASYQRTIHDDMVKPFPGALESRKP